MRKNVKKYLCSSAVALSMLAVAGSVTPQQPSEQNLPPRPEVRARFVPDSIGIGDRFMLEVEVDKDVMQVVGFPQFDSGRMGNIIEIVGEYPVDTLKHEGRSVSLRKRYLLQSFEDGYYSLGRFPMLYADKNVEDTVWSADTMKLFINTFEIDTTKQTIYDIKPVMTVFPRLGEFVFYVIWGVFALALICGVIWFIYTKRRNLTLSGKPKPVEPPHVAAIRSLEELHNQKLWQNGRHKQYYTRLTDIMRMYLEGRYGIGAMEMTTDQIMGALADRGLDVKNYHEIKEILGSADLVKFAKFVPEADYNEQAYTDAYYFVENTKPAEVETPPAEQEI